MNYGFLDAAKKAKVPIVPMVIEYTYDSSREKERITRIHIHYGKPILVGWSDDLAGKLEEYSEEISTWRWNLIEEKGLFKRSEITNQEYINFLKGNYKNLQFGKKDRTEDRQGIQDVNDEFYVFHHINDIAFDEEGNLLGTPEAERLKEISLSHGIRCVNR